MSFEQLWDELLPVGRAASGGYRRFAWTPVDLSLREWFAGAAMARGLTLVDDRAGNQWAWWGDPDQDGPGVVAGSHLDSVPDGGAFDGPLGVVSALAAVEALRAENFVPSRPIGVVNFGDEEGARFGIACAGSRLITGALGAERALGLSDGDGVSLAEALTRAGRIPGVLGRDDEALGRVGVFVELHVEQGRGLVDLGVPVGVASSIWPHGRWRVELPGEANHAGTTRLEDRNDPMLGYAMLVLNAREAAATHNVVATCGKVVVEPNGINAIPSRVTGWVDSRGPSADGVREVIRELDVLAGGYGGTLTEESWTDETTFDEVLRERLTTHLGRVTGVDGSVPVLATGAGHDAGILANAGVPTAMLFVRNPTGVSHSPAEFAEPADCRSGVAALTDVLRHLAG